MLTPGAPVDQLFCELVAIPSPSGRERGVGEAIAHWLADRGVAAAFDAAGEINGSDCGNLIATLPGAPGAPSLLFVAHMDTVETGAEPVVPVIGPDGVIRSAGETILGADNKSAVAAAMRMCAFASGLAEGERPSITIAFTCREEAGQMGASLLSLPSPVDCAFSVDGSSPIGTVITRALGQQVFTVVVRGRSAHAAAAPEAGVSAVAVAGEAIARMPLGRLPGGGSASIAAIVGGAVMTRLADATGAGGVLAALETTPTNSVPELAMFRGEVRGYTTAEITDARARLEEVLAEVCCERGAAYEWHDRPRAVPPFPGVAESRALELARAACARVPAAAFDVSEAHATLEANYLAADTDVVALCSGGRDAHRFSESIAVGELQALEALLCAIVGEAAPDQSLR